uniref:Integrase catalytic domain-containing protein n=1 Tax=Tanacetum cinerariifolium TaxID=118510 RepID=A0A699HK11_TANCI|nr:hypothetical protein [Tanacetum cinerariifolium]
MEGLIEGGGPEGVDDRDETPPLTKEQIEGHVSAFKSLIKSHNRKNKGDRIRLDFKTVEAEIQGHTVVKGKEVMDEDLRKPFKEARRTPFTPRIIEFAGPKYKMPNNIKLYDGTTDLEDHLSRFAGAANSGEWPMLVWCRMFQQTLDGSVRGWFERLPHDIINEWAELGEAFAARFPVRRACFKEPHEITKITRKANESLTAFKERWTVETCFIMGVPGGWMILFGLWKHTPALSFQKEETGESHRKMSLPYNGRDTRPFRNAHRGELRRDEFRNSYKGRDAYRANRARDDRASYPLPRGEYNRRVTPVLTLNCLTKHPKEILAIETQLRLPIPRPMLNPLRLGNADRYCDYHQEKGHYTNDCIQLRKQLEMALESGKAKPSSEGRASKGNGIPQENTESWMNVPISFPAMSSKDVSEEPLIVEAEVEGCLVRRVFVDEGSPVEVMFEHCFENLNLRIKDRLRETQTDLVGFAGEVSKPLGKIELEVCFGNGGLCKRTSMKFIVFPTSKGVATLVTRMVIIAECRRLEKKQMIEGERPEEKGEVAATKEMLINPSFPDQLVTIGGGLSEAGKDQLKCLLKVNVWVFAWEPSDMAGMPRRIIEHTLNVNPYLDPVCQKRGTFSTEKSGVVANQVFEWAKAGIVRPVKYPTYISNPVLVKKGDGTWRMCIDFKKLNSACPKDYYPLLNIDCKVESVMGFKYKCFLDAYKGYHQIQMAKEDEEKTAFYTDRGTYCYTKMPFELKNAGTTYQRLVDSAFQSQIGRNFEAYVDDMVIKNRDEKMLLADIAKTFDNLKKFNMKLNPKKCSFGVEEGKFLDYVVTSEGVRANPKKTKALADLQHPRTLKEMQSLNGKLASLSRFLAKSSERSLSFLNTLKNITKENKHEYRWTTLNEAERNYAPIEKLALSLIHMTWRLRRYFEAHPVKVITDQPIKNILSNTETSEKLAKYAVELGAYNITFIPRNVVKGQVLADFLSEAPEGTKEDLYFRMSEATMEKDEVESWTLFTDGASSPKGSGAAGLRIALQMNISNIDVKVDSKLVASQINETYEASKDSMIKYLAKEREYVSGFKSFSIENIPRNMNQKADVLSKLASVAFNHLTKECLEEGTWPKDKNEARCLRAKIGQYTMESRVLFKKGYLVPMLRCVGPLQANYVVREIHMGSCGMHVGPRAVVRKAIRQGYYWPTMHEDAKRKVEKYNPCQEYALVLRLPKTLMTPIMAPWSFYQWGMDILRPLPPARGGAKFVIVAIDYFTKWIEAKPLVKITCKEVIHFAMDNIICRFGLPRVIVTNNGPQLANGLVERANRSLIEGIKTCLRREKAGWVDELLNVLWAHQTSIKQSNRETPFSLTYGSEAVITAEIGIPTYRTLMIREGYNEEEMRLNLDLLQERREAVAIREAKYKTKMKQYCNRKVRPAGFRLGDFVFRRNKASRVEDQGKLGPKWEGPYRVVEAYENGSYKLQTLEDKEIPLTWYAINLRKCYM